METKKKTTKKTVAVVEAPKLGRSFTGKVTSVGMQKTIVAQIDTMRMNQKYQKKYRVSRKFHIHDEKQTAKVGDTVRFVECRPMSKTKRWRLVEVVKK